jgi:hypothetical protein
MQLLNRLQFLKMDTLNVMNFLKLRNQKTNLTSLFRLKLPKLIWKKLLQQLMVNL